MSDADIQASPAWERIPINDLGGLIMVIGAPNLGKSSLAVYLYRKLTSHGLLAAFLDGDPGQTFLGPPTTVTMILSDQVELDELLNSSAAPENLVGETALRSFVESTTPYRHMLPLVIGDARLVQAARQVSAQAIIHDTCGLIEPDKGGLTLKLSKIDLLRPDFIIAIQKDSELEPLLTPLRRSRRARLFVFPPSPSARSRSQAARRQHRTDQYFAYFRQAARLRVKWTEIAVFPQPRFYNGRLVSFEDNQGFCLALGIVLEVDLPSHNVTLLTPLRSLKDVDALRLGDVVIDPETFRDERKD